MNHHEPLAYHGRALTPAPINADLEDLVEALAGGRTVVAELEPGDATYYNLVITPCWAPQVRRSLGRFGVPDRSADRYLLVTCLRDDGGPSFFAQSHVGDYDVPLTNAWSRELVAWWLRGLWQALAPHAAEIAESGVYEGGA